MREIEQKFELADEAELPSLDAARRRRRRSAHRWSTTCDATYYDTPDLRLAAGGVALRRRHGGDDEGWHLKESVGDDERLETHAPLGAGRDGVPEALAALVRSRARRRGLVPIATLENRRTVHRLLGDGRRRAGRGRRRPRRRRRRSAHRRRRHGVAGGRGRARRRRPGLARRGGAPTRRRRCRRRASWASKLARARRRPTADAPRRSSSTPLDAPARSSPPTSPIRSSGSSRLDPLVRRTTRTPCTRCASPRDGCAARWRRSAGCSIAPSPSRSGTS